jgi:hypothetical protein
LWKLFSFILTPVFYIQVASKVPSSHSPCPFNHVMRKAELNTNTLVLHKSMTLGQKEVYTVVVTDQTFYVFYEPQLCELPISYNAMNVKIGL